MKMDTKVKDLVSSAIGKIHELSDADTVIGNPIKIDGGITIIPVSKVSYGFAAGGSDLPSKTEKEIFGGGSGGGVTINPLAFIVVSGEDVKLLELGSGNSPANAIVSAVPDLITKIQSMFTKKKDKDSDAPINIADISEPSASSEPEIEKVEINTEGFDF
ncbi:MAG: sporulation protein YtfJ [Oscillospiraceae bacterium]|nr:sporulation protein YtfJ [Oscillospiraceae bacterium]